MAVVLDIAQRDAGTDERRHADRSRDGLDLGGVSRLAGRNARDDHAIDEEELGGLGGFFEAHVSGDGMRRVFLLDVGKDANAFGADGAAIAQQGSGARFDDAFVGDVRKDKTLDAHEARPTGERNG